MTPYLGAPQRGQIHLTGRDLLALPPPGGLARHDRLDPQMFDLFPALEAVLERRCGARPPGQTRPHRGPVPGGDQPLFECVKSRFHPSYCIS